ncbi:hypothetical protein L7F22_028985 [Adiantum nelumboides]|nr:hypothetical protein [Adiantum nelumboides]
MQAHLSSMHSLANLAFSNANARMQRLLATMPATFNRMMDRIFQPLRHCVGTFFDDMIVFSKSEVEHMEHLRAVFEMLRKERLVVNGKKSEFFMEEIHFLGHIVSKDEVRMNPAKIKAIQCEAE